MNSHEGCEEMSLTKGNKGTKRTEHKNQADQAHVRSRRKKQKVQIRRPSTEVKRRDEFLSSCSQYRTSRTRLHSACWLAGIPQEMQCVSVCMSETECKREVQSKFFLGPFGAGHDTTCIKECIRAIDHVSIFKVTNSVLRTPHACGTKFQSARVLGLVIAQPGIPVGDQGRSDSGHCSLAAMWSKDPGQARSGRRFRIDAWPLTPVPANIPLYVQLRLARIASFKS